MVALALLEARAQVSADALEGHVDLANRIVVNDSSGLCVHSIRTGEAVEVLNA